MDTESNVHSPQSADTRKRKKKTLNACIGCRNRKTRCSGRNPCERCIARKESCIFEERERKALVPVDYIETLLGRIKSLESQLHETSGSNEAIPEATPEAVPDPSHELDEGALRVSPEDESHHSQDFRHESEEDLTNTLVASEPQIQVKRYGQPTYLGHSSTLSFSRNVRNLLQRSTPVADPGSASVQREDVSYTTTLPPIGLDLASTPLPRLQYAEYLTSTVIMHLGSLYCLFEPDAFLQRLRAFYDARGKGVAVDASLWHVQMLLVLAFGKSILSREHSEMGPSGMAYFTRAMEAFPDVRRLCENPLMSIEILCLASLFTHATDMLQESYIFIGQALRISVTQGLNQAFPEALRPPNVEYMRRLWWSVYCIDRKSAALLGSPSVMRDEDISIPLPVTREGDESQNSFAIHVALSSHLGKILDVIYGMRSQRQGKFVTEVQAILSRLAETSAVLNEHLRLDLSRSNHPTPREAATLHLLLHQCVILTVRPVLFSLLKPVLSPESSAKPSASPFESLLKMCVESSVRILQIMFTLKQQTMCDIFLPYDIDALFSAAFALILIDIIRPAKELLWDLPRVVGLLDEFVARHVAPAKTYRLDLLQLVDLHEKVRGGGGDATEDSERAASVAARSHEEAVLQSQEDPPLAGISPDPVWSRVRDGEDGLGPMHPDTIMSVVHDLDVEGMDLFDATMSDGAWMWNLGEL